MDDIVDLPPERTARPSGGEAVHEKGGQNGEGHGEEFQETGEEKGVRDIPQRQVGFEDPMADRRRKTRAPFLDGREHPRGKRETQDRIIYVRAIAIYPGEKSALGRNPPFHRPDVQDVIRLRDRPKESGQEKDRNQGDAV